MSRWIAAGLVAAFVLAVGWASAPADATPVSDAPVPMSDPAKEPDMDHDAAKHHHHQHNDDHRGGKHTARGLGEHHHHHHAHPHGPDPHHHHPH